MKKVIRERKKREKFIFIFINATKISIIQLQIINLTFNFYYTVILTTPYYLYKT